MSRTTQLLPDELWHEIEPLLPPLEMQRSNLVERPTVAILRRKSLGSYHESG